MKITNKKNLPDILVRAVESHTHKGGDYSASMLTDPVRIVMLKKKHYNKIEVDVTDRLWALFGSAVHNVVEKGADKNELVEAYFCEKVGNVTISGTADHYKNGVITDWKTDSVWTIMYGSRNYEREIQLNVYAWLFRKAGFKVDKLQTVSLLKDWSKTKARTTKDYPKEQVIITDYNLWDNDKISKHIENTVAYYELFKNENDNDLPICNMEDRWQKPTQYAVMKPGRKSAIKLHDSKEEAEQHAKNLGAKHYVEVRESTPTRCIDYCECKKFCNWYQNYIGEKNDN